MDVNSRTAKVGEYIPPGFSMSTILSFTRIGNKHDKYRDKAVWKCFVNP